MNQEQINKRIIFERESWEKLAQLAKENNISEFYTVYAEYLEKSGIESSYRAILHKMAKSVVDYIDDLKNSAWERDMMESYYND